MTELQRETSFRTALKNQKRRLSATKAPTKILPKSETIPTDHLKSVNAKDMSRQNSQEEDENVDPSPISSALTKSCSSEDLVQAQSPRMRRTLMAPDSPYLPRTPSPLIHDEKSAQGVGKQSKPRPASIAIPSTNAVNRNKSPIPPDSPLLCRTPPSPTAKKVRDFNRELRRARSFRRSMERSRESSRSRDFVDSEDELDAKDSMEMTFSIRKYVGGRQGWKIMPEGSGLSTLRSQEALKQVVGMIRQMELTGHQIPERISIKV